MPILGAHMSIAGGYYKAVEAAPAAAATACSCSPRTTTSGGPSRSADEDAERFRDALAELEIGHPMAHDSYLINLASPDDALWQKSVDAFVDELHRAEALGIPYVVPIPGASPAAAKRRACARRPGAGRGPSPDRRPAGRHACWKPRPGRDRRSAGGSSNWRRSSTASQSPSGWASASTPATSSPPAIRLGTEQEYRATMAAFDRLVGLERVKAFHLNDSQPRARLRVDRHEHIGRGQLGLEPFRLLLNDRRFRDTPMYLETPKGKNVDGEDWDVVNLATLRSLIER